MIYTAKVVVTGDTKTGKLVLVTSEGKRIAVTTGSRRHLHVDVVVDDRPKGSYLHPKEFVRALIQELYTPEQVALALGDADASR